jgi:hypothetical protein
LSWLKVKKVRGGRKIYPPPLRAHTLHGLGKLGGMGVAFFKFGGGYLQTTYYIYYDIKYTKNFLPPPIPPNTQHHEMHGLS